MTRFKSFQHFLSELCDISGWLAVKTHEHGLKTLPLSKWDDFAERLSYGGMFSTILKEHLEDQN